MGGLNIYDTRKHKVKSGRKNRQFRRKNANMNLDPNNPKHRQYISEVGVEHCRFHGLDLSVVWDASGQLTETFENRKEAFFIILRDLLRFGYIVLQRDVKIIFRTPEEWEEIFRAAFPKGYDDFTGSDYDQKLMMELWFMFDECPAYPVYIFEDGDVEWWD